MRRTPTLRAIRRRLTKMMTLYLLFEALDNGTVAFDESLPISVHAASQPPSKLGLMPGQSISAENAILALVTKSANDVAAAVAERLAGSESRFAWSMTAKARRHRHVPDDVRQRLRPARSGSGHDGARHGSPCLGAAARLSALLSLFQQRSLLLSGGRCTRTTIVCSAPTRASTASRPDTPILPDSISSPRRCGTDAG